MIGGIARFKVYGEIDFDVMEFHGGPIDLMAMQNGGKCLCHSNAHFGHPKNLIKPGRALNMGDGWETAVNIYNLFPLQFTITVFRFLTVIKMVFFTLAPFGSTSSY